MDPSSAATSSLASTSMATAVSNSTPARPQSATEAIKQIEIRIAALGPGPHTALQQEELRKLTLLLQKFKQQKSASKDATASPIVPSLSRPPPLVPSSSYSETKVLDKRRIQELVKEVDPLEQLDDDVEEMLMQIADDFIDNVVNSACQLAKHRKSSTVEAKDVQLHLERNWNLWVPGFGSEDLRPYKKAATTEAHKQRMALIKKTLKKF